jgi:excinuclease ABC subunit B
MQRAIDETARRRKKQQAYNEEHGITPETIKKNIAKNISDERSDDLSKNNQLNPDNQLFITQELIGEMEKEMLEAAEALEFERAAMLRDKIEVMKQNVGKHASNRMFAFKKNKKTRKSR